MGAAEKIKIEKNISLQADQPQIHLVDKGSKEDKNDHFILVDWYHKGIETVQYLPFYIGQWFSSDLSEEEDESEENYEIRKHDRENEQDIYNRSPDYWNYFHFF